MLKKGGENEVRMNLNDNAPNAEISSASAVKNKVSYTKSLNEQFLENISKSLQLHDLAPTKEKKHKHLQSLLILLLFTALINSFIHSHIFLIALVN